MQKHSLMLLAAAIGLAATQASAADLPRKAPAYVPPAPPPITWTGCYIGANVGGIFGHAKADFGFGELSTNNSGFAGGGQIGCDYQFTGGWVIGIRNMFDGTSLHRDRTILVGPLAGGTVDFTFAGFNFGNAVRTRTGWKAGGGVEWMFARGWSAFLEGNFMDFGDNNHTVIGTTVCLAPVGCAFNTKATATTVLVGVNYRFGGWGGY